METSAAPYLIRPLACDELLSSVAKQHLSKSLHKDIPCCANTVALIALSHGGLMRSRRWSRPSRRSRKAGAFAVVLEAVPAAVARAVDLTD